MPDKRFIEESFPVKEVSALSAKEKNIRHGHISTLHIWWARRPLAASRATAYAALIPAPKDIDEWNKESQFIIDFAKWENTNNPKMIERARKKILKAYGGKPPKVLDPFGGGGSIPLECLRLGCETYSNDLNPVAVLIQKCTLEYPQKYGKPGIVEREIEEFGEKKKIKQKVDNVLLEDVKYWENWIYEEAKNELSQFYPNEPDGSFPIGYLWARTVPCQNPNCGTEIPLMRQYWLSKKKKKKIALFPFVIEKQIQFKIVGDGYENFPVGFDPENGSISRATVTCFNCGSAIESKLLRNLFLTHKSDERLIAIILSLKKNKGKFYKLAQPTDHINLNRISAILNEKVCSLRDEWGENPLPNENLPPKNSHRAVGSQLPLYNILYWEELFNDRQKLLILTLGDNIKKISSSLKKQYTNDYAEAIMSYMALSLDMTVAFSNKLSRWENTSEAIKHLYSRQILQMLWDYVESNPFSKSSGSYMTLSGYAHKVIENLSSLDLPIKNISQISATSLSYPNNFFDGVFTASPLL